MRNKDNILFKFAQEQSDFAPESLADIPFIQLSGRNHTEIEGIYKIIECNENIIELKFKKERVRFSGEGLFIKSFTDKSAVIKGKITSIEFL